MRADNDLLRTTYQAQRNAARIREWRRRYQRATGIYPMGNVMQHKIITRAIPCKKSI